MSYEDIEDMLDELEDLDSDEREDAIQEIRDKIEEERDTDFITGAAIGGMLGGDFFGKDK